MFATLGTTSALRAKRFMRRREVERSNGDGDVRDDAEEALEVIRLLVAEVVANCDDGDDEDGDLEDLEA
ncbi:hypothetical protein O1611_g2636 [Lasiodiplodia mahajangana]|uniref:Uncharacterized protein n=1 Tax=Lasiodiplodia mahajangana TaxID=1108764 RepID=A0ACC2JUI1_9PEZI|nr:hypothetical protein O1611_g2636 [Lasiodiplodia mahajangana]